MAARKKVKSGLLFSGILLLCLLAAILLVGLTSYEGHCISFEPPLKECTLGEFLAPYLLLLVVYWIIGRPLLCLMILAVILAPTGIGWLLDRRTPGEIS